MPKSSNKRKNGKVTKGRSPFWLTSPECKRLVAKVYLLEQQLNETRMVLATFIQQMLPQKPNEVPQDPALPTEEELALEDTADVEQGYDHERVWIDEASEIPESAWEEASALERLNEEVMPVTFKPEPTAAELGLL
jgi:hypothetical protein